MRGFHAAVLLIGTQALAATPTFYKDILPLLQKNCQSCHRTGEIGPMPLTDYRSTRPWAKSIKAAVVTRKMPPWFADPGYGHFANDRRLKEDEINMFVSWVNAGAPEGDVKDSPATVHWRQGWGISPDVVFQDARAFYGTGERNARLRLYCLSDRLYQRHVGDGGRDSPRSPICGSPHECDRASAGRALA